jgi:hypothetical protein
MGKKELKEQNPDLILDLVEVINKFDPTKTGKLTAFLIKMFRKGITKHFVFENTQKIVGNNDLENVWINFLFDCYGDENLKHLKEYSEHLEADRIPLGKRDINKIENWDELINIVSNAKIKLAEKKLKKEIMVVFEDEDYLVVRPLSFEASTTYGSGTKWCTASINNPDYFYRYSKKGVLSYLFDKKNNKKFGIIYEKENNSISFWNEKDDRLDSIETNLPDFLLKFVYEYSKKEESNYYYFTTIIKEICDKNLFGMDEGVLVAMPMEQEYVHREEEFIYDNNNLNF